MQSRILCFGGIKMKKMLLLFLISSILMFSMVTANERDITIKVDGSVVKTFGAAPYIDPAAGRTMVPAEFVAESIGGTVDLDIEPGIVHIKNDFADAKFKTGSSDVIVNGKLLKIDSVPVINEEVIFIPLRFAFEIFSARVKWDKNTRTIEILTGELDFLEPEISVVYPRNKWEVYEFRIQLDNWVDYLKDDLDYEVKIEFTEYPLNKKEQPEFYGSGWVLIETDRWRKIDSPSLYELLPYYTTRENMFELKKGMEFEFIVSLRNNKTGEIRRYLGSAVYKDLVEWIK